MRIARSRRVRSENTTAKGQDTAVSQPSNLCRLHLNLDIMRHPYLSPFLSSNHYNIA